VGTPVVNTVFIVSRSSAIGWVQLETFRFQEEYDNEYKMFSVLSSARA